METVTELKPSDGITVQRINTNGIRSHVRFKNVKSFSIWYRSLEKRHRIVFEAIFAGKQKPKFDIDCSGDITREECLRLVKNIVSCVKSISNDALPLVYDISSQNGSKLSFHVVFDNVFVSDHHKAKSFAEMVLAKIDHPHTNMVDLSVYKSVQFFRCEGSTKPGQSRYKYIIGCRSLQTFLESGLVSQTSGCSELNFTGYPRRNPAWETSSEVTVVMVTSITMNEKILLRGRDFNIRESKGNLLFLDTLRGYDCISCKRVHEKENPFIVFKKSGIFLNCRRSSISIPITVGYG
jgi:hypothetical protein